METPESLPPAPPPIILEYGGPDLQSERPLLLMGERIFHFFTAIVLPIVCFAISGPQAYPPGPEYQRDRWNDYLGLIPTAKVGWPFYPLLLFAIYAAARTIFQPRKSIELLHIRVGLYSGVILAYQYALIQVVSIGFSNNELGDLFLGVTLPIALAAIVILAHWLVCLLIWNRPWFRGRNILFFWLSLGMLGAAAMVIPEARRGALGLGVFGVLFLAPGLTLTSFAALSLATRRRTAEPVPHNRALFSWIAGWLLAYSAAWTKSYLAAVDAYYQLPKTNPSCYIATAAAQGHRSVVRSWPIGDHRMNGQLAILKAGELRLASCCPRGHRTMRRIYDAIGPALARRMGCPWIADLAYLTLKPVEWLTAAALSLSARLSAKTSTGSI